MNKKYTSFALLLLSISTGVSASDASYQELLCETESKWSERENSIYRESLRPMRDVDHYANIQDEIEPLKEKSRAIVKKNCLAGKSYKAVAPEIKKIWTDGCAPIVNPSLNIVCMEFMGLNDGSNLEKMLKENPSLAELVKRAGAPGPAQDCSPGVSNSSEIKEHDLKKDGPKKIFSGNLKQ